MSKYEFSSTEPSETKSVTATAVTWVDVALQVVVRGSGLLLLGIGMFIAIKVVFEAWGLYHDPTPVERFATRIEQGSQLDAALFASRPSEAEAEPASLAPEPLEAMDLEPLEGVRPRAGGSSRPPPAPSRPVAAKAEPEPPAPGLRLSYFAAWAIILMLLLLVGRLAIAAIATGGQLALYDVQLRRVLASIGKVKS